MKRVVITGLGIETPLGSDLEAVFERLMAGEIGVKAPSRYGEFSPPSRAQGEIPEARVAHIRQEHPDLANCQDRRTLFGVSAARRALQAAGLSPGAHPQAGVFVGTGPGAHRLEDAHRQLAKHADLGELLARAQEVDARSLLRVPAERTAVQIAKAHGITGRIATLTTACSASNQALGLAFRAVRSGACSWAVAGGCDSQNNPLGLVFFVLLGASASHDGDPSTLCRPFDRKRSGLVMGEGAGMAVLESEEHALARGAPILAEVAGYGASLDAWRTTAPPPDGRGAAEAMSYALRDAGLAPDAVDYIHAHGTGTKRNDPAEIRAIHTVFGEQAPRLCVSSSKGALGHLLSAAAGVSFALTALALARHQVLPTANLDAADVNCDLDLVPHKGRDKPLRAALNNSFAFGGQNASMALRHYVARGARA